MLKLRSDRGIDWKTVPVPKQIPEGRKGKYEVIQRTAPAGTVLEMAGGKDVRLTEDRLVTILRRDRMIWMSDTPMELQMMGSAAAHAKGDVLVGGLGLGLFPRLATKAKAITIVEICPEVVQLVWSHVQDRRMRLMQDDVTRVIEDEVKAGSKYDFVYLDIWDSCDYEYLPWVNWLVTKAKKLLKPGGEVMAWAYEWMVKLYVRDCMELYETTILPLSAIGGPVLTEEKMRGLKAMYPMIAVWLEWVRANPKANPVQRAGEAMRIGRTISEKPKQVMECVTDKRVMLFGGGA